MKADCGFGFRAYLCRFYALLPAGLSADEVRSTCCLANEARQDSEHELHGEKSTTTGRDCYAVIWFVVPTSMFNFLIKNQTIALNQN